MEITFYILLTIFLIFIIIDLIFAYKVLNRKVYTDEEIEQFRKDNDWFDLKWYEDLEKEDFTIKSKFSYTISGEYIKNPIPSNNCVIICHGIMVNRYAVLKYAKMFLERGYNIVLYDNRRHGKTDGKFTTYGYYEKYDLSDIVDHVSNKLKKNHVIGLIGESMGSAITLQCCGVRDGIDFVISDCGFTTLTDMLIYHAAFTNKIPKYLAKLIVAGTGIWMRILAKTSVKDTSPLKALRKMHIPAMIIHGDKDTYIPFSMAQIMYDAIPNENKRLYIVEGAKHAMSYTHDRERYENEVETFLKDNNLPYEN